MKIHSAKEKKNTSEFHAFSSLISFSPFVRFTKDMMKYVVKCETFKGIENKMRVKKNGNRTVAERKRLEEWKEIISSNEESITYCRKSGEFVSFLVLLSKNPFKWGENCEYAVEFHRNRNDC